MICIFHDKTKLEKLINLFTRLRAFQTQTLMSSHVDSSMGDDDCGGLESEELDAPELDVSEFGTLVIGREFGDSRWS